MDRQVGLDGPGDDLHVGALGGEDHVDAGRPGLLGEAEDVALDVLLLLDQIGVLVDDEHHVGHLGHVGIFGVVGVELVDVGDGRDLELVVAELHQVDQALEGELGVVGVGDDRAEEMRDVGELGVADHLRVMMQIFSSSGR